MNNWITEGRHHQRCQQHRHRDQHLGTQSGLRRCRQGDVRLRPDAAVRGTVGLAPEVTNNDVGSRPDARPVVHVYDSRVEPRATSGRLRPRHAGGATANRTALIPPHRPGRSKARPVRPPSPLSQDPRRRLGSCWMKRRSPQMRASQLFCQRLIVANHRRSRRTRSPVRPCIHQRVAPRSSVAACPLARRHDVHGRRHQVRPPRRDVSMWIKRASAA